MTLKVVSLKKVGWGKLFWKFLIFIFRTILPRGWGTILNMIVCFGLILKRLKKEKISGHRFMNILEALVKN